MKKHLTLSFCCSNISQIRKKSLTKASIEELRVDLGRFPWQQSRQASFVVRNSGHLPLIVENVSTGCGCVTADYPKEPTSPGDSLILTECPVHGGCQPNGIGKGTSLI
ncbi:MAG: DUF1573 domain-containing protein [Mediterranea sp.]|nr:DUF1573 domain-containing protein [Mediterranea sp.]